jgi:hypothetical protein
MIHGDRITGLVTSCPLHVATLLPGHLKIIKAVPEGIFLKQLNRQAVIMASFLE